MATSPDPTPVAAREAGRHVIFRLGGELFAASATTVQEILHMPAVTRVPRQPAWLLGVTNLRGDIISVLDVRSFLDCPPAESTVNARLLVCRAGGVRVAVVADAAQEIAIIPPEEMMPADVASRASRPEVHHVHFWSGKLVSVLDLEGLLLSGRCRLDE